MTQLARRLQGATSPYPNLAYVGWHIGVSGPSSYTFAGVSFGSNSRPTRRVIVFVSGAQDSGSRTLDSITVGGVGATIHARQELNSVLAVASANIPLAASGDVVVNFNDVMNNGCRIAIYELIDQKNSAPTTIAESEFSTTIASVALAVGQGEVLAAAALRYSVGSATAMWSGATEQFDLYSNDWTFTGAMRAGGSANSDPRQATFTVSSNPSIVALAWR